MRIAGRLHARPRALAAAGIVTAGAVVLTTLAFTYQGYPTTQTHLNDGSVWVTNESSLMVGHFNDQSAVLDGGLSTTTDDYDVLQAGQTVLLHDIAGNTVATVNPDQVTAGTTTTVPAGSQVALGGQTVAVLSPAKGTLWALPAAGLGAFKPAGAKPQATLGAGAVATVGVDGTVYAVSPRHGTLTTIGVDPQGEPAAPRTTALSGIGRNDVVTITAVGDTPVVLDRTTGRLITPSGLDATVPGAAAQSGTAAGGTTTAMTDDGTVLQQPSPQNTAVTVATPDALLTVPLDGSAVTRRAAGGTGVAAAPVWLNGCAYGAWAGSGRFVRECTGGTHSLSMAIPGVDGRAQLRFRQNRDIVVLNDIVGGSAWMASTTMQRVDNWQDLMPPKGQQFDNRKTVTTDDQTVPSTPPKRDKQTPPVARPDDYGVRPGRTTILPVLENDTDADGDVLTVSLPDGGPNLGPVQTIDNGSALQITVPAAARGTDSFVYEASDGQGGSARARVTLTVHPWDQPDQAPTQKRVTTVTVESGATVTQNILSDWTDPDGDDVFLRSAQAAPGDQVDVTGDGRLTYHATSGVLGRKDVTVYVSDGMKTSRGTVRVDVRPNGSTKPVTVADHVTTHVGQSVTVSPLANDVSAGDQQLRLARVGTASGITVTPDYPSGTFTAVSQQPGTYYLEYLAASGSATAPGLVRVDVQPNTDSNAPPVAVRDVALLRPGGDTLVNVLANDHDPAGRVLVVQSAQAAPDANLSVAVLGHQTVRITDLGSLSQQTTVSYTVSDGLHSATGQIIVIPVPAPAVLRPPIAHDDTAVVRAGDVVTIPVLHNDTDPDGGVLHVDPTLVAPVPPAAQGTAWVSQDTVRFKAGMKPGTAYVTYNAVNASGQKDAGYVTIQILPISPKTNQAPQPQDVTGRVLAGGQVRIPVPLSGIDPDGDSVTLMGIASAPHLGRITAVGPDYLDYESVGDKTGTDEFTYRVTDTFGAQATASVRVGVAPAPTVNQPPYAVKDTVAIRPGRRVAVPVLANDSDPNGYAIGLVPGGLVVPHVAGLSAKVDGDMVVVTAPDHPLQTSLQYTIQNSHGARAVGVVPISVRKDVPLRPPVAQDDYITQDDIKDGHATVNVLANDTDPDGVAGDLTVSTTASDVQVHADGRVTVPVADHARLILYTVTNPDGLTDDALIHVPALTSLPPVLRSTKAVTVKSGQTVTLPLNDYVRVSRGSGAVITEAGKVSALHGDGASLVKDAHTLVYTSAKGYSGPDAITFEVTDGQGPDDPHGVKAMLVLPISVHAPDHLPPTFMGSTMNVAPGEQAQSLDLRALTGGADKADLAHVTYTLRGGVARGLDARIDGQTLRVSAGASTPKGTTATLTIAVDDGHTPPVTGTVQVTVTASTRPLPVATDDVIPAAHQGQTVSVDVLRNDVNPFPDKPLNLVSAVTETGTGTASVSGSRVLVTPDASFVGQLIVRYRIADATGDPSREVDGRIILTVQGVPAAPGTPTVTSVQDRTVVLSWTPPVDNGAPITKYTVTAVGGGFTQICQSTTCTLTGLVNNTVYNFTVKATNAVGDSPASAPSQDARPDARPDTPAAPALTFGDQSVAVAWATPGTPGSPVQSYNLQISPAPASGVAEKTGVTGNALTWAGLANGTAYQVRVQAVNLAPEPSAWSAWSATQVPARAPDAPGAPSTSMLSPVGSQAQMQVSWNTPADNGDTVAGYQLAVINGSSVLQTLDVPAGQTSQAVRVSTSTTDYTYKVRARNKAGWGSWSSVSAPRRAVTTPGAPGTPTITPGDGQVHVTFAAAPGNGALGSEIRYQYSVDGSGHAGEFGWTGSWTGTSGTVTGLMNGTSYNVRVRAVSTVDGATYAGAASGYSNSTTPYGQPGSPGAGASASGTNITYSWNVPAPNGRPVSVYYRIDGGGWTQATANGATTRNVGYSHTGTIEVYAQDSTGQKSATVSDSARTADPPPPPQPSATVSEGAHTTIDNQYGTCTSSACAYVVFNYQNFPGGTYSMTCMADYDGGWATRSYSLGAGNGSIQTSCVYGYPNRQVWIQYSGPTSGSTPKFTW